MILVQHITSSWSKASRGGPSAARRNAVPEALPLPDAAVGKRGNAILRHSASYREDNDFSSPSHDSLTAEGAGVIRVGCVSVEPLGGGARVAFDYDLRAAGMPPRGAHPRASAKADFELAAGEWGRVLYNGRFSSDEGGWWYQKTVVNVGCYDEVRAEAFVSARPLYTIDRMANLW
ncbi:MAG TPA: hypothetical protein VF659_06295 [Pyrinomonadaceae bacterium]